jgi:hypothetical protein
MTIAPEDIQAFDEFDTQLAPGYRAQLVAGEWIVHPPANGNHETVVARIAAQLGRSSEIMVDALPGRGIQTSFGRYIPARPPRAVLLHSHRLHPHRRPLIGRPLSRRPRLWLNGGISAL